MAVLLIRLLNVINRALDFKVFVYYYKIKD